MRGGGGQVVETDYNFLLGAFTLTSGIALGVLGAWVAMSQKRIAARDLTLTAYSNAIQGIIALKNEFAVAPGIMERQILQSPKIRDLIPASMEGDIPSFLVFAAGMWRLSYVHSVMTRWQELGLTEHERDSLKAEILLWLRGVPGFYDIYCTHFQNTRPLNKDFMNFLEEEAFNSDFHRSRVTSPGLTQESGDNGRMPSEQAV
jgi:hypothetical protein